MIKCPECNHSVSSKAPYCPNCGVLIDGNVKRCPVCGTYVLMNADKCPNCDAKFVVPAAPASETPAKEEAETPVQETTVEQTAVNNDSVADAGKKSSTPWYLLVLAILVVAIGGFLYWESQNQAASEEEAFAQLQDCTNPLNYEDFIARFPNSSHIDEVRKSLHQLQKADAVWEVVSQSGNVYDLENYLKANPASPYKKVALHKIDSLDWRTADRNGSSRAYDAYIVRHDNGEYLDKAYEARDRAREREERARHDSIAAAVADSIAAAQAKAEVVAAE